MKELTLKISEGLNITFFQGDSEEEHFLISNKELARVLDIKKPMVRTIKHRNQDKIFEGEDWTQTRIPTEQGFQQATLWTRNGAIKISQIVNSPQSKRVKKWLEQYRFVQDTEQVPIPKDIVMDLYHTLLKSNDLEPEIRQEFLEHLDKLRKFF
ncbi:hypothetical protein [Algivirga pacifica]|uniref:Bro-N domain-containing protein n=1 Tax=Algivirga pacifica TaxID=1162670 RepID=A0ABP9D1R5_9BACT